MKNIEETTLDALIKKVQAEGIDEANRKAEEIIKQAKGRAAAIIDDACKEAEVLHKKAEEEIKTKEENSRKSLDQAARDTVLTVQNSLAELFESLIQKKCSQNLTEENLSSFIRLIIKGWQKDRDKSPDFEILLNQKDRDALFEGFLASLKDEIKSGVELKAHPDIEAGFRFGAKGEHMFYDFTDQGIAEVLAAYLNPRFKDLINSLNKIGKG